jgi:hypothetical protein
MAYVLQNNSDGLPTYFSAKVGRNLGAGSGGWVAEPDEALQFAREQDARTFADAYLPHLAPFCTITRHERPA